MDLWIYLAGPFYVLILLTVCIGVEFTLVAGTSIVCLSYTGVELRRVQISQSVCGIHVV